MLTYILITIVSLIFLIYWLMKQRLNYWKNRNVPHLKPTFLFGNYKDLILLKRYVGDITKEICEKFPDEPYIGAFYGTEPALIVQDPELVKLITTKDYYFFSSREVSEHTHKELFTQNMFFTYGDRWKILRQNFTPIFSSAKMKNMFHLIAKCSEVFEELLARETKESNVVDIRDICARFTMDCVGSCIFGVETDAMGTDVENNSFKKMGDKMFEISNFRGFSLVARAIWPSFFYGLRLKTFPSELNKFFHVVMTGVFNARNYEPSARNDFVDLLLNMSKNKTIVGDRLSNMKTQSGEKASLEVDDALMVAQAVTFFTAGYETSATTLSNTLYELAKNEEAQDIAAAEAKWFLAKHKHVTYDCVSELPYLDACLDEALRLYPVLSILAREVVADYTLPSGLKLEKGMRVHLPVYHLQRHPAYFPEPLTFKPERFLSENKHEITPYTYFPFGEGPRICIGMRFAKMQMLPGLVTILNSYRLSLAAGMARELTFEPRAFVSQPVESLQLQLTPR